MEKEIVFVLLDDFADWEAAFLAPALRAGTMPGRPASYGVKYMTPEWNDCLRLAVGLADSLGMDIVLPSAPGWSNTGGPWVAPDDAMKRIEWRDTVINGGTLTSMALPAPYTHSGEYQNYRNKGKGVKQTPYYKDLYVIAVPVAIRHS